MNARIMALEVDLRIFPEYRGEILAEISRVGQLASQEVIRPHKGRLPVLKTGKAVGIPIATLLVRPKRAKKDVPLQPGDKEALALSRRFGLGNDLQAGLAAQKFMRR